MSFVSHCKHDSSDKCQGQKQNVNNPSTLFYTLFIHITLDNQMDMIEKKTFGISGENYFSSIKFEQSIITRMKKGIHRQFNQSWNNLEALEYHENDVYSNLM